MEDYIVDSEKVGPFKVEVVLDTDTDVNPREWSHIGTMICRHRRYNLGDVQLNSEATLFSYLLENEFPEKFDIDEYYNALDFLEDEKNATQVENYVKKHFVVLPLYLYDHSGITMNTTGFSCGWDSGQVGYTYVNLDNKELLKEHGLDTLKGKKLRNTIADYLISEVNNYDDYLRGDVYGYRIVADEDVDDSVQDFIVDDWESSCWGFLGDAKYALEEGVASAKYIYKSFLRRLQISPY